MSASEVGSVAWPWLWPTALLIVWIVASVVGVRRLVHALEARLRGSGRLSDLFLRRARQVLVGAAVAIGVVLWGIAIPAPETVARFLVRDVQPWLWPSVALAVWIVLMTAGTRRIVEWFEERAARSNNPYDDALVTALRRPLGWLVVLVGVAVWADLVPLPAGAMGYVELGSKAVAILVLVLFTDGFVHAWMTRRALHSKVLATSGGVLRSGARMVIWTVGLLMVISTMGIDITPILASLGLGSLAIGLALKNTLEDFFAGLLLAADQAIRVGDFVYIEAARGPDSTSTTRHAPRAMVDEGGWVLSIGWRTTRLRTREDVHVIVPNSRLALSTLYNRSLPHAEVSFTVELGVHFHADLEHVSRVVVEVATDVQRQAPQGVPDFTPRVVFRGWGESRIDFRVWLRARSWDEHFGLRDAFIRALHPRLAAEGIVVPFPIRTLDVPDGAPAPAASPRSAGARPPGPPASGAGAG